ncbi:mRNA decay activator protein ZFP36L2 [Osmerus mordax]|uniref:mRNA decay activator protein ZFP36L2 n=1 Tax=Osmerus mordax TaxID=8014 RepID=UPI00350EB8D3
MRELLRQKTYEKEMSATILSAFYDIDMLYKQEKSLNMNAIHINSMLDKKAVGAPVTTSSNSCPFAPGFFRRNSTSNLELMTNSNKYSVNSYSNLKENLSSSNTATALMNKENKFRDRAYSENGDRSMDRSQQLQVLQQKQGSQINSTRYKTELCRPFEENGACKYGEKCQFAHGYHELRSLSRHPKYKTEPCRTFHTIGFCPYGPRCHFIHNADERRPAPSNANMQGEPKSARELCGYGQREVVPLHAGFNQRDRPKLHHSLSFSGFSSHHGLESPLLESPTSRTPPPPSSSCSPNFYEDVLSPNSMSCVNSAFSFPSQDLKALLAPLAVHTLNGYANQSNGAYYGNMCPSSPTYNMSHLQSLRRLSESPVFDSPPSPPDSLSDRDSYASGSLSSSGSLSGSESPSLDAGKRLPIFSRLSISDD